MLHPNSFSRLALTMKLKLSLILLLIVGCVPIDPNAGQTINGCQTDADCSDGLFCNGIEYCYAGERCFSGNNPCSSGTTCNESSNTCEAVQPPPALTGFDKLVSECSIVFGGSASNTLITDEVTQIIASMDALWELGVSFDTVVDLNREACSDNQCIDCFDRVARYVWFELHSADPPIVADDGPPFVSGNVFSFLSIPETDLFRTMIAGANNEITQWRIDELNRISQEIANSGLSSGGSQARQLACNTDIEATRRRRDATWQVLNDHFGLSRSVLFTMGVSNEVDAWNRQRYPDPTCP